MQMTPEGRAWLDDLVRRVLARHPVRDPERAGVTYELMSHVHAAAERKAVEAGRSEITADDLRLAVADAGGEDELARAFVQPMATPAERAGFWPRAFAYALDAVILGVGTWFLFAALFLALSPFFALAGVRPPHLDPDEFIFPFDGWEMLPGLGFLAALVAVTSGVVNVAYFTFFEGREGRSLGKRALRLRVVRLDGQPMTYREALVRNVAKASGFLLLIDVLAWGLLFREDRQRASDRIAETAVIRT